MQVFFYDAIFALQSLRLFDAMRYRLNRYSLPKLKRIQQCLLHLYLQAFRQRSAVDSKLGGIPLGEQFLGHAAVGFVIQNDQFTLFNKSAVGNTLYHNGLTGCIFRQVRV